MLRKIANAHASQRWARNWIAVVATLAMALLGLISTSAANAAVRPHEQQGPAVTAGAHTIHFKFDLVRRESIKRDGARPEQVGIGGYCEATGTAVPDGGTRLFYYGIVGCSVENFAVSDDWFFYSKGKLYAADVDFGTSTYGEYISEGTQSGGVVGHREVVWCLTVTDNSGATGGGCLIAANNV
jgi:hypothetical protein